MPFYNLKEKQPERKGMYKVNVKRKDGSISEYVADWTGFSFKAINWDWQKGDEVIEWYRGW